MEPSVRMTLRWSVPLGEVRPISAILQGLMVATRVEHGCAGCSLSTDIGVHGVIHYVEDWNTEDDLKRQLRSDRFAVIAELMERANEQPTVEFSLPGATRGLEYVEEVRGAEAARSTVRSSSIQGSGE